MGISDIAAARLRYLQRELSEPHVGGSVMSVRSRPTSSPFPAPSINLGALSHIEASVAEIVETVRDGVPDASPLRGDAVGVYEWAEEHSRLLDEQRARNLQVMVYRQALEHAVAAGEHEVVCREQCPGCGCWSLTWWADQRRAVCFVMDCVDAYGRRSMWTLHHVAEAAIRNQLVACAT